MAVASGDLYQFVLKTFSSAFHLRHASATVGPCNRPSEWSKTPKKQHCIWFTSMLHLTTRTPFIHHYLIKTASKVRFEQHISWHNLGPRPCALLRFCLLLHHGTVLCSNLEQKQTIRPEFDYVHSQIQCHPRRLPGLCNIPSPAINLYSHRRKPTLADLPMSYII